MKRHKPMKRSAFKRKPGSPMKRNKPMGPGKVATTRKRLMKAAIDGYFAAHGWEDGTVCYDQVTGLFLQREDAVAHHKCPESELRKAGLSVEERNQPERLIVCHWASHKAWVHWRQQGRPRYTGKIFSTFRMRTEEDEAERRFRIIEESPANASNNLCVSWSQQDEEDMFRFLKVVPR